VNVLLTCAGRRSYLVEYFRLALRGHGLVCAVDAAADAPALQDADRAAIVPPVDHADYTNVLREVCRGWQVGLLISLNDLELPRLSEETALFAEAGTVVVVSCPEVVEACFDKWRTYEFLSERGIRTARSYLSLEAARKALAIGELSYPVTVKPRWGTASVGVASAQDDTEMGLAHELLQRWLPHSALAGSSSVDWQHCVLIQETLRGEEHGMDVVNDLAAHYVATFARRKLSMRAGETDRAITVDDTRLHKIGQTLGEQLGHVGNLDCDVFVDGDDVAVLELNPRFGGGYPFSHLAGVDLPAALLAWARGERPRREWLTMAAGMSAAKRDVMVITGSTPARVAGGLAG
jgi:carbamoyl-phosphate synthase large subunit